MAKGDEIRLLTRTGTDVTMTVLTGGRKLEIETEKQGGIQFLVAKESTPSGTVTRKVMVATDQVLLIDSNIRE